MKRIISRIDIKKDWIVKGIQLEGLRAIGHPVQFSKDYYNSGIDELLFMDVVASLYQRNMLLDLIKKTATDVFVPITLGGGMRSLEDISQALKSGADKIAINTAAHASPEFINNASNRFGSSTITVCIEAIKSANGEYYCFTDNGREPTGKIASEWAKEVAERGAGEIVITSVDNEGTGHGFDLELTKQIASAVTIPVIAHGGAGNADHVAEILQLDEDVSGVCIASLLHYNQVKKIGQEQPVNSSRKGISLSRKSISDLSVQDLKKHLQSLNIDIRASHETN